LAEIIVQAVESRQWGSGETLGTKPESLGGQIVEGDATHFKHPATSKDV
jgi:hypothetical protein